MLSPSARGTDITSIGVPPAQEICALLTGIPSPSPFLGKPHPLGDLCWLTAPLVPGGAGVAGGVCNHCSQWTFCSQGPAPTGGSWTLILAPFVRACVKVLSLKLELKETQAFVLWRMIVPFYIKAFYIYLIKVAQMNFSNHLICSIVEKLLRGFNSFKL